ncbi:membrane fusion protein (multidrug efflux system) [Celerinatantimonas diazotrophica]|uniref:Membrane fusion protein (Multidrug efflux system) n=1 Tax=Celerinatantimonas diazotrophica TaxID=412034 RepID=A0A4V2PNJ3_9GAMM|nr:membrane fusion protein (multidrug efflux system) [Celerinatantimonas diazotrophica]CAG9295063.1 Multidrug efflux pump subunit AcrA [Celerinatantimonas diazotrophica]
MTGAQIFMLHKTIIVRSLGLALAASLFLTGCGDNKSEQASAHQGAAQAIPVNTVTISAKPIQLTTELSGRVKAFRVAQVRPQVSGIILKRYFTEGSNVKAGELLYQIDPATYQADVDNARANLAEAKANAHSAGLKAKRYAKLIKTNAISEQDYDDAQATWKQQQAAIEAAQASLEEAQINLKRTKITAPISGRIGVSDVSEGALVTANQTGVMATIQQLDPVYVDVQQSTEALLRQKREIANGSLNINDDNSANVHFILDDNSTYQFPGRLQFSDVTVDPSTGMVDQRIIARNPQHLLLPGMFIRAVLHEGTRKNAILVPQKAVSHNPRGEAEVMLVNADDQIQPKIIKTERAIGQDWLVSSGLKVGDKVVVAGLQNIRQGSKVQPNDVTANYQDSSDQTQNQ